MQKKFNQLGDYVCSHFHTEEVGARKSERQHLVLSSIIIYQQSNILVENVVWSARENVVPRRLVKA